MSANDPKANALTELEKLQKSGRMLRAEDALTNAVNAYRDAEDAMMPVNKAAAWYQIVNARDELVATARAEALTLLRETPPPSTGRNLASYRPQHDEDCDYHLCAICTDGNTHLACRVAGEAHGQRRSCTCGLDALLVDPSGERPADPQEQK